LKEGALWILEFVMSSFPTQTVFREESVKSGL
jgi:hypothetical protein